MSRRRAAQPPTPTDLRRMVSGRITLRPGRPLTDPPPNRIDLDCRRVMAEASGAIADLVIANGLGPALQPHLHDLGELLGEAVLAGYLAGVDAGQGVTS